MRATEPARHMSHERRSDALLLRDDYGHIGHMRKASLADAKAHLSEIVDAAEHRGKRILILRHGKPAAAIVPVEVAFPPPPKRPRSTRAGDARRSVRAFVDEFSACDAGVSAVEDLRRGRR